MNVDSARAGVEELHALLVSTPSVSGSEAAVVEVCAEWLRARGAEVEVLERNLVARAPGARGAPDLLYLSHLDTVPPTAGWSRAPWPVARDGERIYGLGANDAKAAVAAMAVAFTELLTERRAEALALAFVCDEETGGRGAEWLLPLLGARGETPRAAVVGEPTGLAPVVAQKGLLVLELDQHGDAGHAAHARRLGARNALVELARDLIALEACDLGPTDPVLGPCTLVPTVATAGSARNQVPASAQAVLDVRTVPGSEPEALAARVQACVSGRVRVRSSRLRPCRVDPEHPLVEAARRVRPSAACCGSATLSDWVWLGDIPAIKCGPGLSERSHTADEYVLASELHEGAQFYAELARAILSGAKGDRA